MAFVPVVDAGELFVIPVPFCGSLGLGFSVVVGLRLTVVVVVLGVVNRLGRSKAAVRRRWRWFACLGWDWAGGLLAGFRYWGRKLNGYVMCRGMRSPVTFMPLALHLYFLTWHRPQVLSLGAEQ